MGKKLLPEDLAKSGTEHGHQSALFFWTKIHAAQYPQLEWLYAIPNGGGRSPAEGARLKAEGVKGGVADICLPVRSWSRQYVGLYIEMKKPTGTPSSVSEDQYRFGASVWSRDYYWVVCFTWEQAVEVLEWYLTGKFCNYDDRQHKCHDRMLEVLRATS